MEEKWGERKAERRRKELSFSNHSILACGAHQYSQVVYCAQE